MNATDALKFTGLFALVFGGAYVVMGSSSPQRDAMLRTPATTQSVQASAPTTKPVTESLKEDRDAQFQRSQRALHALCAEVREHRRKFDGQLESLQLDRLLDAAILIDPDTYIPARSDLRAAAWIIDTYEQTLARSIDSLPVRLKPAGITVPFQLDLMDALHTAPIVNAYYANQVIRLERDRVARLTRLLDFVGARVSSMSVRGGALICDDPNDDAKLMEQLRPLAANRQQRRALDAQIWVVNDAKPLSPIGRFDLNVP